MPSTPQNKPNTKPVIGLLGAPGAGKSTVAGYFAELGCGVIDADRLAHEALQTDAVRDQLKAWWGDSVIDEAGQISRPAVGQIVFSDPAALKKLESVLHPLVHAGREKRREQFDSDDAIAAIIEDTPLLLESGKDKTCDALVYVDCPFPVRLQRLAQSRGWDAEVLQKRENQQASLDTKRQSADYVISNDQTPAQVREQVRNVLSQVLREAS